MVSILRQKWSKSILLEKISKFQGRKKAKGENSVNVEISVK